MKKFYSRGRVVKWLNSNFKEDPPHFGVYVIDDSMGEILGQLVFTSLPYLMSRECIEELKRRCPQTRDDMFFDRLIEPRFTPLLGVSPPRLLSSLLRDKKVIIQILNKYKVNL